MMTTKLLCIGLLCVAIATITTAEGQAPNYSFPIEPTHSYRLRNGSTIPLPSNFYADAVFVSGLVLKDAAYEKYNFDDYYKPVSGPLPGTLVATLGFFHYTYTDAGPYNELALIFPVTPSSENQKFQHPYPAPRDPRAASIDSEYSTSQALWLDTKPGVEFGREIWGYPKKLCDIDYEADNTTFRMTIRDQKSGRKVCSIHLEHDEANQESLWSSSFGVTPVNSDLHSFEAWNGKVNPYILQSGRYANARWLQVAMNSNLDIEDDDLGSLGFIPVQFWRGRDVKLAIGYPSNFADVSRNH